MLPSADGLPELDLWLQHLVTAQMHDTSDGYRWRLSVTDDVIGPDDAPYWVASVEVRAPDGTYDDLGETRCGPKAEVLAWVIDRITAHRQMRVRTQGRPEPTPAG